MNLVEAMEIVYESIHESADVIFGTTTDSDLAEKYLQITFIATGLNHYKHTVINNIKYKGIIS